MSTVTRRAGRGAIYAIVALVVVMIVTLVTALLTTTLAYVYVSIACSVLASGLLIATTARRIKEYKAQQAR